MKPFLFALLFIAAVFAGQYLVARSSPDRSAESGVKHHLPPDDFIQAQEAE